MEMKGSPIQNAGLSSHPSIRPQSSCKPSQISFSVIR